MYLALAMRQCWWIAFILEEATTTAGLALIMQRLFVQVNIMLVYGSMCVGSLLQIFIFHSDTTCIDDTVRLVGGRHVKEGMVEMCYNGQWHSICSDNWSEMDGEADVVCSTLGYSTELG